MINADFIKKENKKEQNPNWSQIPDYQYRVLIIGGSEWGKTNVLLNLLNHKLRTDEIYLHAEDGCEEKF